MISLKSDRDLNEILNSYRCTDLITLKQPETHFDYQIEFIDAQSTEEKESVLEVEAHTEKNESVDDVTPLKRKTEPRKSGIKKKRSGKRKSGEEKISCEMCGKLVAPKLIEYHLNAHKGWRNTFSRILFLWRTFSLIKKFVSQK